jgi:hypothetical protein
MALSPRRFARGVLVVAALAAVALALGSGRNPVSASSGVARSEAAAAVAVAVAGEGPRNLKAEAASGAIEQMVAVVQETVDCLRAKGYSPGDPVVRGQSVVINAWNPSFESAAGQATEACSFPDR